MTLVELLVVVGIISVLTVLVVVSINPQSQTSMALEARARSNVSEVAKAMVACIAVNKGDETSCNTWADLYSGGFVSSATQPAGVVVGAGCVSAEEADSLHCKYQTSSEMVDCDQATACTPGT